MNKLTEKELDGVKYEVYSSLKEQNGVTINSAGYNGYSYEKTKDGYIIYIHPKMDEYLNVSQHPKEFLKLSNKEVWPKLFYFIGATIIVLAFVFTFRPIVLVVMALLLLIIRRQSNVYFAKKYAHILSQKERQYIIRDGKDFMREMRKYVIFSKLRQFSPDFYRHLLRECRKVEGMQMYED